MGTSGDHHCLRCMFGGVFITTWGIYLIVEAECSAGSLPMTYPALTTTFGILIFLAAFMGCLGSRKNSVCLLSVSCVILSILVQETFVTVVGEVLKYEIQNPQNTTIDRESIYNLQKTFECCGGTGPLDWNGKIPASCCASGNRNCQSPYQTLCGVICIACLASKVGDYEKM
ncbi:hypothetical protein ACTXT7_007210 [Hymenolepis weldensis]